MGVGLTLSGFVSVATKNKTNINLNTKNYRL
ncbi:hypothetical protein HWC92_gp25 [Flavobacterium phage vB_FspS_morran9-1]|uniref:Uncharacterized protein n=7 Tax=Lillamyvirus TaxID=2843418 RepID=A0A6B9LQQ8_9CAUD|nr:hypothetical protein HWC92_gp25 [Flavobacterium phage vB_FspS_morran9-1]YP_009855163.1 hypothetical protein HWC95_gp27 [Flavobacterium phage vB_FspS_sniff9-1]YP_009855236.1 hypothetical protein HWC96_gp26 [Flavobacterium phage vB_FspS_snork6-1]QHB39487.1 hypothetical protein lillamy97_gp023 [Flavobacterium phage vB_FspS_lillamy9-7]QHB40309.1 hypothetical protein sniff92_gp025 [Flavobacterium phage vB_FspS_sniff9-2]QHB40454.1 hypothetical protein snork62_gp024 [Flavobacterium phage vB_FspS_s